jgi:hypothetical protein
MDFPSSKRPSPPKERSGGAGMLSPRSGAKKVNVARECVGIGSDGTPGAAEEAMEKPQEGHVIKTRYKGSPGSRFPRLFESQAGLI